MTMLKPKWTCKACTYVNINGNRECEVCQNPAPIEAYYTEEEINKEEGVLK